MQFHDAAWAGETVFFYQYMVVNWLAKHLCLSNWAGEKLPKSVKYYTNHFPINKSVKCHTLHILTELL